MGFPNVPNVPGVPPLPTAPGTVGVAAPTLLTADASVPQAPSVAQWGIFLNGAPVVTADSVLSFTYKSDYLLLDYPVEQGSFQTYNKVKIPFDVRVRYASGSDDANRQALLDSLDAAAKTLSLYDVVTPEKVYTGVNITHVDYHRTSVNGVGLIAADVWLSQIITTATATFSQTKQASGAQPQSVGAVQPVPATPAQVAPVNNSTPSPVGSTWSLGSVFGNEPEATVLGAW